MSGIDFNAVTERLKNILDIKNQNETRIVLTQDHVNEIKEYLKALDLIVDCPIESINGSTPLTRTIFTQPGMRYCQAQALVFSLMRDETFTNYPEEVKNIIQNTILNDIRGRMMEDMILLETIQTVNNHVKVFKLQFARGEFDMVAYNQDEYCCACFEIKHSNQMIKEQTKNLINDDFCEMTENRFGEIVSKTVLYRGDDNEDENGIEYKNVEQFLIDLPDKHLFELDQGFSIQMQ